MLIRVIVALLIVVAFCSGADAAQRGHHTRKHHHYHHRVHVQPAAAFSFGGSDLVSIARSQLGNGAIYGRSRLWCARFMNWTLERAGYRGTGSDLAMSFARMPRTGPQVGAIAVMGRRGGGHVGVVSGFDGRGNPLVISGNHAGHVREAVYPAQRIVAYVRP